MPLLVGAPDGVHRVDDPRNPDPRRVLDAGLTNRIERFDGHRGVFAASEGGLYRSTDGGEMWTDLGVPGDAVVSVGASPDGRRLYAGTRPAHVHVSTDGGETWARSESFASLPGRDEWANLGSVGPQVRTIATDPSAPARVLVSVEAAGVYASPDGGETWVDRSGGVNDDVHHLLSQGEGSFVASCGRGLFRTDDAGRTWTALDTSPEQFWYTYFRAAFAHDGRLFAASEDRAARRFSEGSGGAIWVSTDGGHTFEREAYPGDEESFVLAWCADGEDVYAVTESGRLLIRDDGAWESLGHVVPADDAPRRERALLAVDG